MSRLALPQAAPDQPVIPLGPPASAWGSIRAAHAILGGLHLTLDWAVRGLLLLKTRLLLGTENHHRYRPLKPDLIYLFILVLGGGHDDQGHATPQTTAPHPARQSFQ